MKDLQIHVPGQANETVKSYTMGEAQAIITDKFPNRPYRIVADTYLTYPIWRVDLWREQDCLTYGCGPNGQFTFYRQVGPS